jgi:hypothetical protein
MRGPAYEPSPQVKPVVHSLSDLKLTPPYPDNNLLTLHGEQFLTSHQQPPHQSYHQDHTLMVR